jgi:competence protein ComGC
MPVQAAPQKKSHTGLIVGIVVGLLGVLFVCGILAAVAVPVFLNSSGDAAEKSCWANERYAESVVQLYLIENEGATLPADWDGLMSVLLAEPDLDFKKAPVCPSGGTYSVTGSGEDLRVTCSIHGQAPDDSTP